MAEPTRLALIGCGGNMTNAHLPRLLAQDEVSIVALVDPVAAVMQALRERHPVLAAAATFADHEKMLDAVQPDGVVISSPHALHHPQIIAALRAGAHVLVEKPMVNTADEAAEVIATRDETGKIVMVSYQRRFGAEHPADEAGHHHRRHRRGGVRYGPAIPSVVYEQPESHPAHRPIVAGATAALWRWPAQRLRQSPRRHRAAPRGATTDTSHCATTAVHIGSGRELRDHGRVRARRYRDHRHRRQRPRRRNGHHHRRQRGHAALPDRRAAAAPAVGRVAARRPGRATHPPHSAGADQPRPPLR